MTKKGTVRELAFSSDMATIGYLEAKNSWPKSLTWWPKFFLWSTADTCIKYLNSYIYLSRKTKIEFEAL